MEELSSNTSKAPEYDVYFSYDQADTGRVGEMSGRLQDLFPGFLWFDELEHVPGLSETITRQKALDNSKSLAVVLGPARPGAMAREELKQVVRRSVNENTPAFFVYLPGSEAAAEEEHAWLGDRKPVDLREQFDAGGRLTRDGLVQLIAAVRSIKLRDAANWLSGHEAQSQGTPSRPPLLRGMIAGIASYQAYPELPSVRADTQAVTRLLRPTTSESQWELVPLEPDTKEDMASATESFFAEGGADDVLLFYFSGHGEVVDGDLYLAVQATKPRNPGDIMITAFPIKALAYYVRTSQARRKLVVLDCCYSGEAADQTDWGAGSAVFMTPPQPVEARTGLSDLTRAITVAWEGGAETAGDLRDRLADVQVRYNKAFDRSIQLPRTGSAAVPATADSPPSTRLSFSESGDLYVSLWPSERAVKAHRVEMANWDRTRQHLVTNLIEMIDTVVSLVPAEKLPMKSVKDALMALGDDLLRLTLTQAVRDHLGDGLAVSPQLRLELSFDDRWAERGAWERLPWESLLLCKDGNRSVWLERIVRGKAYKSFSRRPPSRVIAWNAFQEAPARYPTQAKHLLTHLLRAEVKQHQVPLKLVVKEPAQWEHLFQATLSKTVDDQQAGGRPERVQITDFDTFALFAPVSLADGQPVVWFPQGKAGMKSARADSLIERLKEWSFSYLIIETIAGQAAPLQGTSEVGASRASSLQATTQLATKLARDLGVAVVAVCHLPSFIDRARPEGEDEGSEEERFMPSFSGQLLRMLADPTLTLSEAAHGARKLIVDGLSLDDSDLDIGLPIVCRPENDRSGTTVVPRGLGPPKAPASAGR